MTRLLFILLALLTALPVRSGAATNDFCTAGVAEFNAAHRDWDGPRFGAAVELFRRATTNAPANSTNLYWLGVAQFHRMLHLEHSAGSKTNQAVIEAAREAALDAVVAAVTRNDADAESHALLGTLYGMKIEGSFFRALRFGPSVASHQERALKHGADNPRVQYLHGMCQFHTAKKTAEWQAALQTLLQAGTLFEAEAKTAAAPLDPRWGWSSCLTFIGRACERLGKTTEAAAYFRKALALHPQDTVARDGLKRVTEGK